MKKILRMTTVFAGIISVVSTVILGYIYVENLIRYMGMVKSRRKSKAQIDNTGL